MTDDEAAKLRAEVERLTKERDELARQVYVPGLWECARCGCNLVVTEIHAATGAMRAGEEPQRCPNDCGPMWRKTERKAGNEVCDRLDAEIAKREAAESALAAAQKLLQRALDHIVYMHNFGRHRIIAAIDAAQDEFMKSTSAVTGDGKLLLDELRAALAGGPAGDGERKAPTSP